MPLHIMTQSQAMCQHTHNAHKGRVAHMRSCASTIAGSDTVTPTARAVANQVLERLAVLEQELDYRVNADGKATKVQWSRDKKADR